MKPPADKTAKRVSLKQWRAAADANRSAWTRKYNTQRMAAPADRVAVRA